MHMWATTWDGLAEICLPLTILKLSSFGAEEIVYFSRLGLYSCVRGAESSHMNAHRRILNVLYMYTET